MILPKVNIDHEKCTTPFDCAICMKTCPQAVFILVPKKLERGKQTNRKEPGSYTILGSFIDKCTVCMKCVEVCPEHAIEVRYPLEVRT